MTNLGAAPMAQSMLPLRQYLFSIERIFFHIDSKAAEWNKNSFCLPLSTKTVGAKNSGSKTWAFFYFFCINLLLSRNLLQAPICNHRRQAIAPGQIHWNEKIIAHRSLTKKWRNYSFWKALELNVWEFK